MRSAIPVLLVVGTKQELRLFERLLKHLQHHFQGFYPHRSSTRRSEMLDPMNRGLALASEREVDQAFFLARSGGSGETRHAQRDVGLRALKRAFGHRPGDDFGNR